MKLACLVIILIFISGIIISGFLIYKNRDSWTFNPDFDIIKWSPTTTYKDYRQQIAGLISPPSLTKWRDKIWLSEWMQTQNLPGPRIFAKSYNFDQDISKLLKNHKSYCAKPSHLSCSIGVIVVKDGILQKDLKTTLIGKNIHPYNKDLIYEKIIKCSPKYIQKVPSYFSKFKKGYRITPVEVSMILNYMKRIIPTWHCCQRCSPPGFILEELLPLNYKNSPDEYKITVGLGKEIWKGKKAPRQARSLAIKTAKLSGAGIIRIDIVRDYTKTFRIGEITWNGTPTGLEKKQISKHFWKLRQYHLK